jgi:hypothetical protein
MGGVALRDERWERPVTAGARELDCREHESAAGSDKSDDPDAERHSAEGLKDEGKSR